MLLDLTLIWDDEYTREQWEDVARRECLEKVFVHPGKPPCTLNQRCSRDRKHRGPCVRLEWKISKIQENGIAVVDLVSMPLYDDEGYSVSFKSFTPIAIV